MVGRIPVTTNRASKPRTSLLLAGIIVAAALLTAAISLVAQAPRAAAPAQATPRLYVLTTVWGAGAAQDTQRLHLEAVVVNTGKDAMAAPAPDGFSVRAADGRQWQLTEAAAYGASPADLIQPGEQRNIDLFADVPVGMPSLWLTMAGPAQGTSIRIR